MTIGFTGTNQTDIADGVDESDGRWITLIEAATAGSAETVLTSAGSGATPGFQSYGVLYNSGQDGDWGALVTSGFRSGGSGLTGTLLISGIYFSLTAIGSLSDDHGFGLAYTTSNWEAANDSALFRPHVGNTTSGNVRVDNSGSDTDGSVDYGDITEPTRLTVILDAAGNYVTAGHTAFYVDGDPRRGDAADADLNAIPSMDANNRVSGFFYESEGNNHIMVSQAIEVAWRL